MPTERIGFAEDIVNALRGLCMGAADIVPGVSGGTMALILGHYQRLVTAISHVDATFLTYLKSGNFRAALAHMDARFLLGIGVGIACGIVALAGVMHYLLEHQQAYTYATFTGLILGSSYLVARRLAAWSDSRLTLLALGACLAWLICILQPMQGSLSPLTAFLAATVAICAMILPGISGAFVLLLLGLYHPITELITGLPRGDVGLQGLLILTTFTLGCMVGLLSFSRLLKWLLAHRHDATMAFLVGLMLGSLVKIWPFQRVTSATAHLPYKEQRFELIAPVESPASLTWVILLLIIAVAATLALEHLGKRLASARGKPE